MADRRTEILEAACRVIGRGGVHELRVEDVAKEVGVSPALVYYYFDTRADLLSRAFEFADARSMTNTLAKLDQKAPAAKQVADMLLLELDDAPVVQDNWVIWSEMTAGAYFDDDLKQAVAKWSGHWVQMIADLIAKGLEDGSIPAGVEPQGAAQRLTGVLDALGTRVILGVVNREQATHILEGAIERELVGGPPHATSGMTAANE